VDEQGWKRAEAMPQSFSLDFSPIIDSASPDGRYLLLLQSAEAGGIPYVFDWEIKQVRPLLKKYPQIRGLPFGWHPDSRQVLFWTDLTLEAGLWLVDVETGEHIALALLDHGPVQGATISPDGQRIAYVYSSDSSNRAMWLVSAAGGDSRLLFDIGGPTRLFSWSPDGTNLLYAGGGVGFKEAMAGTPTPESPLRLVEADGWNIRPLNAPFIFGWGFKPVWSPNGRYIALVGSNPDQAYGCAGKFPPGEGPDWQICRFQGTSIYIEDVLTGETRRLVSGIEPVWSPDGSMIAFLSSQSGSPEIWAINVDGTDLHQLTDDGQSKETFVWFQGR
jgi:Tol biopolymer transport system component